LRPTGPRTMLLLDSSNLSVYEVPDEILSHRTTPPPSIAYEHFESTARSHFCSLFLAAQFPAFRVGAETLVFVQLTGDCGWAWASRIRVRNLDELPIPEAYLGEEFLFLWPVPMAINAYINFKEKARRLGNDESFQDAFVNAVKDHPPSLAFVPQNLDKNSAIGPLKRVGAKEMTASQRLFVASLTPHSSAFSTRSSSDKWTEALRDKDQFQLRNFLRKKDPATPHDGGARSKGRADGTRARAKARPVRRGRVPFDLPDDVVERILSIHIAQNMDSATDMKATVTHARLVCHQFRSTATAAVKRMLAVVTNAARSLLGSDPSEPSDVQAVVHAAGITLRQALMFTPSRWDYYLLLRQRLEARDAASALLTRSGDYAATRRCSLFWGISSV